MEMSISVSDLCFIHAHLLTYQRSFFSFNGTDVDLDFSSPSFSHTPFSQFCARSLVPHAPCRVVSHAPSLVLRHLSYCAISRITPSLVSRRLLYCVVSRRLSYHAVSCVVLSLVLCHLSYSHIAPSLLLRRLSCRLSHPFNSRNSRAPCPVSRMYCPVSRIALSLVSSLMPRLTLTSDERTS